MTRFAHSMTRTLGSLAATARHEGNRQCEGGEEHEGARHGVSEAGHGPSV